MKNFYSLAASLFIGANLFASQPFTEGNLVLYRVGDGTRFDKMASPVFLDEYAIGADGTLTLVQSVPMPTAVSGENMAVTLPCTSHLEGCMTRSEDGRYLVVPGYNAPLESAISSAERVAALVDYQGGVDASTTLPSSNLASFRGAASYDGSQIYFSGSSGSAGGGLFYAPKGGKEGTDLLAKATYRNVRVIEGQLMVGNDANWFEVGEGLPVALSERKTMMTYYKKVGFYDMYIAHFPEGKVAYVASTGATLDNVAYKGIFKYSLVDGEWVYNGRTAPITNCHGLEGKVNDKGEVVLFIAIGNASGTDKDKTNDRGELEYNEERICMMTDATGFNSNAFEGITAKEVLKAPENQAYRAVAWAPVKDAILSVSDNQTDQDVQIIRNGEQIQIKAAAAVEVSVFAVTGQQVFAGKGTDVSVSGLRKGQLYLIKAGREVKKMLF
ncbi:MAG: hypothetical protein ACRCSQ_07415 [Bacteroidales bacterium]